MTSQFVIRRLGQAVATIIGVMIFTFLLFRVGAGDIATAHRGHRASERDKAEWRHKHGYDLPMWVNIHKRLMLTDSTGGDGAFLVEDPNGSRAADALALIVPAGGPDATNTIVGRFVRSLDDDTPIAALAGDGSLIDDSKAPTAETQPRRPALMFTLSDGGKLQIDLTGAATCGELIERINSAPGNAGRIVASVSAWRAVNLVNSQFFKHFVQSITFGGRSLRDNRKLTTIIAEHAPASLALTVPALAISWMISMIISCFVAYYRGRWIDKLGVLVSVLGMCIPFLAFMMFGQWLMFTIAPTHAYGISYRGNIYLPIAIMVIAGLGANVRFYRTVILDEINRDYVRTARAKGLPLTSILFSHVLRNCMLPIMTNLIMAIQFLIMGSLLVEKYFGIPGLGDLMLSSIQNRDETIISGMVLLTAIIYTLGVLVTDLSYAIFDPRIRLE